MKSLTLIFFLNLPFILHAQVTPYIDSLQQLIQESENDTIVLTCYELISWHYTNKGDFEKAITYVDTLYHESKARKVKFKQIKAHFFYGVNQRLLGNFEQALAHLDTNIQYFTSLGKKEQLASALWNVAAIHYERGQYEESINIHLEILDIFQKNDRKDGVASTLMQIANIARDAKKIDIALQNLKEAIHYFEILKDTAQLLIALHNLGDIYENEGDISEAQKIYQKGLEIATVSKLPHRKIIHRNGMARCHALRGNFEVAISLLHKSLALSKLHNYPTEIAYGQMYLGRFFSQQKKYDKALNYLKKAKIYYEERGRLPELITINESLAEVYIQQKQFKEGLEFKNEFWRLQDSIINKEQIKQLSRLVIQYETEKKDKELAQKQLLLDQKEMAVLEERQKTLIASSGGLFTSLVAIILGVFYYQYKKQKTIEIANLQQQQEIIRLQALVEGEEKERQRVAQDLHDGVNGDLVAIKFQLESMEIDSIRPSDSKHLFRAVEMLDVACQQIRNIAHNLIPPSIKNFGLINAIDQYCKKLDNLHALTIQFIKLGTYIELPQQIELAIYRVIQELLNNLVKHANATEGMVQLSYRSHQIDILVEDNGQGFNLDKTYEGIGLQNIKSRVAYLKATMDYHADSEGSSFFIQINPKTLPKT